jgi:hypothetical protein
MRPSLQQLLLAAYNTLQQLVMQVLTPLVLLLVLPGPAALGVEAAVVPLRKVGAPAAAAAPAAPLPERSAAWLLEGCCWL